MATTSAKTQVSIYKVDRTRFDEDFKFSDITEAIIKALNSDLSEKGKYKNQRIVRNLPPEFELRLYHAVKRYPPRWKPFLEEILGDKSPLLNIRNTTHTYLCFILFKEDIYAITGGSASLALDRFVVQNYGLEIITRIFKKNSKVVRATKNKEVTGSIMGQSRFFRGDQMFSDNDKFGTIHKMIQPEISRSLMKKYFGFTDEELKRDVSGAIAKASFQLNKSIDFKTLLRTITKCREIFDKHPNPNFTLNKVIQLTKKKDEDTIERLKNLLNETLYQEFKAGNKADFDFCHKQFEEFLTCSEAKLDVL
jgi:hypothetical protein